MIRIERREAGSSAAPEELEVPQRRHVSNNPRRRIETEYICGCKSSDPHAPDRCQAHGEQIRLTRISSPDTPRFG